MDREKKKLLLGLIFVYIFFEVFQILIILYWPSEMYSGQHIQVFYVITFLFPCLLYLFWRVGIKQLK